MLASRRTTIALLALAFVFRLALAYPTHRYPADADCSLSALCAIDALEGRPPVFFPSGVRLGAPTCYLTAGLFGALGISRAAQAFGPVLVGWATVLVWFAFCRELFGARRANLALLFIAIPTSAVTFWTYMPNAYPEVLFACATILWRAAVLQHRGPTSGRAVAFGLAVGFGVWVS